MSPLSSTQYDVFMRAVIYARISRDTEGTQLGVNRQLEDCRQTASARGWTVVREYVDNDVSASRRKPRPEYERMMRDLAAGAADALVVWSTDRLARKPRENEDILELHDTHGIQLANVGGEIDLSTAQGQFMFRTMGNIAAHETKHMSERHKRKARERAENGLPGAKVPYGWTRVYDMLAEGRQAPGHDVAHEDQARVVREMTERLLAGESVRSIAARLNERGEPTPNGAPKWITSTVRRILLRPTNAGLRVHHGEIIGKSTTEPLITEDQFYSVRSILQDPARRLSPGNRPKYLLTSLAMCGACGAKLLFASGRKNSRGGRAAPSLSCRECGKVLRSMPFVDGIVERVVLGRLERTDALEAFAQAPLGKTDELRTRRSGLQGRLDDAADLYAAGAITAEQLTRINTQVRPELERVNEALADLAPATAARTIMGPGAAERWADATIETRRDVVRALMTVTVMPTEGRRKLDPESVKIEWKA